jgi:hypothetical protein
MAAFPCCTDETRRPEMQARHSVISLAALTRCLRQSNAKNNVSTPVFSAGARKPASGLQRALKERR